MKWKFRIMCCSCCVELPLVSITADMKCTQEMPQKHYKHSLDSDTLDKMTLECDPKLTQTNVTWE